MISEDRINFVQKIMIKNQEDFTFPDLISEPSEYLDCRTTRFPHLEKLGSGLLRKGKVAILMPAGGLSTRMGSKGLRGNLPIGPVSERSIFQLQAEKVAAVKKAYNSNILWLIMTSSGVHEQTVESFQKNNFFDIAPEDIWFFQQDSLPILRKDGSPFISEDGNLLESPAGHGGLLKALKDSTIHERLMGRKIEYLFYFQYPNVLEYVCDPTFLGYHHRGGFDVSTKAIIDYYPEERLGKIIETDGKMKIVEYYYVKNSEQRPLWDSLPANTGTHIWSVKFLNSCIEKGITLPYHTVLHKGGPEKKVEQFIFDLMDHAESFGLMIVNRNEHFSPVKTKTGLYSLHSAKKFLNRLYLNWLEEAGAAPIDTGKEGLKVEISPLYALNADELAKKLPENFKFHDEMILK